MTPFVRQGTAEKWLRFAMLDQRKWQCQLTVHCTTVHADYWKISGNGRGTFRAPCPTRFLGRLGGRASGPISCYCNDMPREHGRLEGTPRVPKSETK